MEFNLTTPAVLFPAVSLLLLAYTNRFLALAHVIRQLHANYKTAPDPRYLLQIETLRRRIHLVRNMQFAGVFSLLVCTVCVFLVFWKLLFAAEIAFSVSVLAMIWSLTLSLIEIQISVEALDLHLLDLEKPETSLKPPIK